MLRGESIRAAGRCFTHGSPEPSYQLWVVKPVTGEGTVLATQEIPDPSGAFTFAVAVEPDLPDGSYILAVTCAGNSCAEPYSCTGPFFALEIVDPSNPSRPQRALLQLLLYLSGRPRNYMGVIWL